MHMRAFFKNLAQHTLYAKLLVLLACVALSMVLMMAGSLFLVDYIPVSQSVIKKIHRQELLWKDKQEHIRKEWESENEEPSYLDASDPDLDWLVSQENPKLSETLRQLMSAELGFKTARLHHMPIPSKLFLADKVIESYEHLGIELEHDIEIKQSVISLLQLLGMVLIMCCLGAIAIGARRVLIDRLDRLILFIPDKYVDPTEKRGVDEFSYLEHKVLGITARLEGFFVEAAWANRTSERLRHMLRAQDFLYKFIEMINDNVLEDMMLRKLLSSLERVLDASNVYVMLGDDDSSMASGRVVFSDHQPVVLNDALFDEFMAASSTSFVVSNVDEVEVRCLAVKFSGASGAISLLVIEIDDNRFLDEAETQLVEITAALLTMVMGFQSRDQEGRRIALLEERAAIARELHDSLAQSLSFMKIQISRLQANVNSHESESVNLDVIKDLREGLDNAYRELRELLATFRVHMDVRGLGFAIQSAIDEFSQRSSLTITLDNRLVNCRLTVNEEFHILHVVREALSNIVRHSGANNVWITLAFRSNGSIMVTIDDDGIGYTPPLDGQEHYGQTIMKERAYSLGGSVKVLARYKGGTRVRLTFTQKFSQSE